MIEPIEPRRFHCPEGTSTFTVMGRLRQKHSPIKSSEEAETACFEKEFHGNFVAPQAIPVKKFQTPFGFEIPNGNIHRYGLFSWRWCSCLEKTEHPKSKSPLPLFTKEG